jgi:PBP superfamily domain
MKFAVLVILSALASANAACGTAGFKVSGANLLAPVALAWVPGYQKQCPKATPITIPSDGATGAGVTDLCASKVDVAMMSRDFKTTEATAGASGVYTCVTSKTKVTRIPVGLDGVTLIVKKGGNADKCLTILVSRCSARCQKVAFLFVGKATNSLGTHANSVIFPHATGKPGCDTTQSTLQRQNCFFQMESAKCQVRCRRSQDYRLG